MSLELAFPGVYTSSCKCVPLQSMKLELLSSYRYNAFKFHLQEGVTSKSLHPASHLACASVAGLSAQVLIRVCSYVFVPLRNADTNSH